MYKISPRKDRETSAIVDTALIMQRTLGDDAARAFLELGGVRSEMVDRVLLAPVDQRRYSPKAVHN